jgi:hypothetical protein
VFLYSEFLYITVLVYSLVFNEFGTSVPVMLRKDCASYVKERLCQLCEGRTVLFFVTVVCREEGSIARKFDLEERCAFCESSLWSQNCWVDILHFLYVRLTVHHELYVQ